MSSWPDRALLALIAATSCGDPPAEPSCKDSPLTWASFGEPFMRSWCTGCHSSRLEGEVDRQGAPAGMNFDTLQGVRDANLRIRARAVEEQTMPPAGGPSAHDRALLGDWLACGGPGVDEPDPTVPTGTDADSGTVGGCARVGQWRLSGATCNGADATDAWLALFPLTELAVTDDGGTCAIEYHVADAGCEERQRWRSDLTTPSSPIDFLGTVDCEPLGCSWDALPGESCQILADTRTLTVPIFDLPSGGMAIGPLAPPDLAGFCDSLGLLFVRIGG